MIICIVHFVESDQERCFTKQAIACRLACIGRNSGGFWNTDMLFEDMQRSVTNRWACATRQGWTSKLI